LKQQEGESFIDFAERVMSVKAYGVKYSLGLCCDEVGIDRKDVKQHRALGDVFLTHALFKKIWFGTQPVEEPTYSTSSFEVKVVSKTKSAGAPLEYKIDNFEKVTKLHPNEVHVLFCEETKEVIKTYLPPDLVC
jgi:DNA polymerase III epsilon subunit-like protein